jgi:hypothetical protein
MLLAFASYFISDCLWSAFFTSKRQKSSHHVKVAVHGEGLMERVRLYSLCKIGADCIGITAPYNSPVVLCVFVSTEINFNKPVPRNGFLHICELEYTPFLSLLCPGRLGGLRAGWLGLDSRQGQVFSFWSVLWLLLGSDNNEVVIHFWSALSLLLGSDNNEVVFSFGPFRGRC